MDGTATRSAKDREDLFLDAAELSEVTSAALIEKDFWVCWALWKLLQLDHAVPIIFKGGTSLSKAYRVIRRFSEDVDLSLDRKEFGFEDDRWEGASRKSRGRLGNELREKCQSHVRDVVLPELCERIEAVLGASKGPGGWNLEFQGSGDSGDLLFTYPITDSTLDASGYTAPRVRLEFGAKSDHWPEEDREVKSYVAEVLPREFTVPVFSVRTLHVDRTFWEKATILHSLANGGHEKVRPRMARHYYDLVQLARSKAAARAIDRLDLLKSVAAHKMMFHPARWASYETAAPGTLRLIPSGEAIKILSNDYKDMEALFMEDPPPFGQILEQLGEIEAHVNRGS